MEIEREDRDLDTTQDPETGQTELSPEARMEHLIAEADRRGLSADENAELERLRTQLGVEEAGAAMEEGASSEEAEAEIATTTPAYGSTATATVEEAEEEETT